MDSYASYGYSGLNLKQKFVIVEGANWRSYKSLIIGINNQILRLRYPSERSGIRYLHNASNDLKCMAALLLAELVPPSIFADKLQDEFPEYEEASEILRQWQRLRDRVGV